MRSDLLAEDGFDRIFETMPADARSAVRRRVLAAAVSDASSRHTRSLSMRAAAVFLAVSMGSSGVAYASSVSLPGSPLYAVKIAAEEISIAALPSGPLRDALVQRAAVERAEEMARLAGDGAEDARVGAAVGRFERAASRALSETGQASAHRAEEKLRESVERVPEPTKERARKALSVAGEKRQSSAKAKKQSAPASASKRAPAGKKPSSAKGSNGAKGNKSK